jgi:competence protein ComEA
MAAAAGIFLLGWFVYSLVQASRPMLTPMPPAAASGGIEITAGGNEGESAQTAPPAETAPTSPPAAPKSLVVHVTGAVNRPGVYTLKPGSRIYHAVRAAGGLKPNAQDDALNQSDFVQDAMQIHFVTREEYVRRTGTGKKTASAPTVERPLIVRSRYPSPADYVPPPASLAKPKPLTAGAPIPLVTPAPVRPVVVSAPASPTPDPPRGIVLGRDPVPGAEATPSVPSDAGEPSTPETAAPARASSSSRSSRASGGSTKFKNPGDGTVNINIADIAELQKLPGVGPAMAARVIEHRQQKGRFTDPSQLMDVKGIGSKTLAKMRPFVTVE